MKACPLYYSLRHSWAGRYIIAPSQLITRLHIKKQQADEVNINLQGSRSDELSSGLALAEWLGSYISFIVFFWIR